MDAIDLNYIENKNDRAREGFISLQRVCCTSMKSPFDPQNPLKQLGMVAYTCNPSPGQMETGRFLGLTGHLAVSDSFSKTKPNKSKADGT